MPILRKYSFKAVLYARKLNVCSPEYMCCFISTVFNSLNSADVPSNNKQKYKQIARALPMKEAVDNTSSSAYFFTGK